MHSPCGDALDGASAQVTTGRHAIVSAPGHRREDQHHRARRLARARGGRGAHRGARARAADAPPGARPRDAGARLPQGQGAAPGRASGRSAARRCSTRPCAARCPSWYEEALTDAGHRHGRRPQARPRRPARARARRSRSRSRSACARRPSSATTRGVEVGRARARGLRDEVEAELERLRESLASLETVERAAAERRLRGDRLRRHGRRRAVRGRRGARLPARARLGPPDRRASRSSSRAPRPATSAR